MPPDLVALAVPVAMAFGAFSFVVYRAFAFDPEWTNGITQETAAAAKKGDTYRNQIRGFFKTPGQKPGSQAEWWSGCSMFNNEPTNIK